MDATSGLFTGEGHIPLACTAEPISAAPITGAHDKCEVEFSHTMSVKRIYEDPRVTLPYTDEQWSQIEALGHQVDEQLVKNDVRLTMGGEPTFVSIDDMEGEEWNTAAMGPDKRRLAGQLIRRLRTRFATPERRGREGGFMHYGQGKWYPGESLPRWALTCYWRKDGIPAWMDPTLIADEDSQLGHTDQTAQRFVTSLAEKLAESGGAVSPKHALPAYEDVWYYLWKERRLPTNVDPFKNELKNKEDRARMARIFEQGLDKIVGYTLPLQPIGAPGSGQWQSGTWFFRPERMYLIPGDSPMGFRLPLDSLPWVEPEEFPFLIERDPMDKLGALGDFRSRQPHYMRCLEYRTPEGYREQRLEAPPAPPRPDGAYGEQPNYFGSRLLRKRNENPNLRPEHGESAPWIIRTAICVEPRHGTLHIFMPPVRHTEDYLELVSRLEETAAELKTPIVIEGYTPPHDPRLTSLKVTPDPGVIEVNVQPVHSWDEAVNVTQGLYEDAHYSRLGTEKFMVDGRHSGTGGGNHIVIGGATPADSPFLRRPDLLKSLVGYWHNHPSLSYLFSGLFIGPTSQAPRR